MSGNHHHPQDADRAAYPTTTGSSSGASKSSAARGEVKPFPQDATTVGGGNFLARIVLLVGLGRIQQQRQEGC